MQMNDMILVSIDDHMVEPPDMYDNHVPDKFRDLVPKVVRNDAGVDEWHFQGQATSTPVRHGGHGRLEPGRVGLQPRLVLGAAARAASTCTSACATWTPTACSAR